MSIMTFVLNTHLPCPGPPPAAVFDQDLAQELPLDQTALDYVSEVARRNDPNLQLEKVRQALGALGLTGSLPLQVCCGLGFGLIA